METAVDAQIDLVRGESGFFLRAQLSISLPGLDEEIVHVLITAATRTCPFSKAMQERVETHIVNLQEKHGPGTDSDPLPETQTSSAPKLG